METSRRIPGSALISSMPPPPGVGEPLMLSPQTALRILRRRTGGKLSRPTIYRWISSGKIVSIRVGYHIFVPWYALEECIEKCLNGEQV
jgi:excisionase family DNA binding protein